VQSDYRRNGQDAIWFLITDSGLIRREVRHQSRCVMGSCLALSSMCHCDISTVQTSWQWMTCVATRGHCCVQARQEYGDKVLASDPNVTATHFLHEFGNTPSLRAAAMDQWLFGLADFHVRASAMLLVAPSQWRQLDIHSALHSSQQMHINLQVISRYSGYGRTGGWRSRKWHGIFTLDNHHYIPRDCKGDSWQPAAMLQLRHLT
jgi:hypothetical protein